jgi:hypothetical protein
MVITTPLLNRISPIFFPICRELLLFRDESDGMSGQK